MKKPILRLDGDDMTIEEFLELMNMDFEEYSNQKQENDNKELTEDE